MFLKRRFPSVLQDETYECGLACIAAVAQYYGQSANLTEMRKKYDITSGGLSVYHLMKVASDFGMSSRGVKLAFEDLHQLRTPGVILWNQQHFVVLVKCTTSIVEIMDPAIGILRYSKDEASVCFSGVALELMAPDVREQNIAEPEEEDDKKPKSQKFNFGWQEFYRNAFKYSHYLFPLLVCSMIVQGISIVMPKFISLAIDEVLKKNDKEFLYLIVIIFGFLTVVQGVASYIKSATSSRLQADISLFHGSQIVRSLLEMPLIYFNRRSPANILRKVKGIDAIHIAYTAGYIDIGVYSVTVMMISFLLISVSPLLGGCVVASALAVLFIRYFSLDRLKSLMRAGIESEVKRDVQILAAARSISSIKIKGLEFLFVNNWLGDHVSAISQRSKLEHFTENLRTLSSSVGSAQLLFLVSVGSLSVLNGEFTVGALVSLVFYNSLLMTTINTLAMSQYKVHMAAVETQRLLDIVPQPMRNINDSIYSETVGVSPHWESTQFKQVCFGYTNMDAPVLSELNFKVALGEKVCVRGKSGAGKTTFVNLLCGLLSPTKGKIYVNEIELDRHGGKMPLGSVAVCSSDDQIIDGTLVDNVVFGSVEIDVKRLELSLEHAGIRSMVPQLLHGLNTQLGPTGASLSSGQKQRLMLARALYQGSQLLILDEPTSHLDDETAMELIKSLSVLEVTLVIITHDDRIEEICERSYFLDDTGLHEVKSNSADTVGN